MDLLIEKLYINIYIGLHSVVPSQLLILLTWHELEICLCGPPDVDIQVLKQNTEYRGFSVTDPIIVNFWTVFEEFTNEGK